MRILATLLLLLVVDGCTSPQHSCVIPKQLIGTWEMKFMVEQGNYFSDPRDKMVISLFPDGRFIFDSAHDQEIWLADREGKPAGTEVSHQREVLHANYTINGDVIRLKFDHELEGDEEDLAKVNLEYDKTRKLSFIKFTTENDWLVFGQGEGRSLRFERITTKVPQESLLKP
jgi:hypothetical protein